MACRWQWEKNWQQYTKHDWDRENRAHRTEYQAMYREDHPEETRQQRLKDWRTFQQRNPERWAEIHRAAGKRYYQKHKESSKAAYQRRKAKQQAMLEALQKVGITT